MKLREGVDTTQTKKVGQVRKVNHGKDVYTF
jgi:hypothetical protein